MSENTKTVDVRDQTCNDCGKEVYLDDILNTYFKKMDAILDRNGIR